MKRVRFAPSPTGTLHVRNALTAVAYRTFGDWMLLRIDNTHANANAILNPPSDKVSLGEGGLASAARFRELDRDKTLWRLDAAL